jgi:uncharacterized protein
MKIERRYITHEFRIDDDADPKIKGYAAVFGVRSQDLGGWVEVIAPTAFDADLANTPDVRGLFNHDSNLVLGRTIANTLTLSTDDKGLAYVIDPPDTSYAKDLIVSMKRGDVTQSSFGFICVDAEWGFDEVEGVHIRTVKQAQLFDVSPVTFPAYLDSTSEARSFPTDMPKEVRSKLSHRDDGDECNCDCAQCQADSCGICSNDDCDDPNCDCQDQRSTKKLHELRTKLALELTYQP